MRKFWIKSVAFTVGLSMVMTLTSCDDADEKCKLVGDEFISAAIERNIPDMLDLCSDPQDAEEYLSIYEASYKPVDAIMETITFEATDIDCSSKDNKGTIRYTITAKDYVTALDSNPVTVDAMVELMNASEQTVTFDVKLEFGVTSEEEWLIINPDDFADDFYGELYSANFPFGSHLTDYVSGTWYHTDSDDEAVYTHTRDIVLDLTLENDIAEQSVYYIVEYNGEIVYKSNNNRRMGVFYADQMEGSPMYLPGGTYVVSFYDSQERLVYSDSCTVNP